MTKLLKILLIWLCALALPLQGMAATAMLACDVSHHQNSAEHVLEGHDEGHDAADVGALPDAEQSHSHHHSGQSTGKCSACASCCIGVGMAATLPQWQGQSPGQSALVGNATVLLTSFMADGLERPPRPVFA